MSDWSPRFRAEHVGSLLRPPELLARRHAGATAEDPISPDDQRRKLELVVDVAGTVWNGV